MFTRLRGPARTDSPSVNRLTACLDIYSAVEDEQLFGRHAQQPNAKCPVGSRIGDLLAPCFDEAALALRQSLSKTTVASLLEDVKRPPVRRRAKQ